MPRVAYNLPMRCPRFIPDARRFWRFVRDPATDWKPKVLALLALGYMMWPIDLIPDFAPVIGWLDDIGVAAIAAAYLLYSVSRDARS